MEEAYVTFSTAKLLKENGFNEKTFCFYDVDGHLNQEDRIAYQYNADGDRYAAPTVQTTLKWLRDEKHLFIGIQPRLSYTDYYYITATIYKIKQQSSYYHQGTVMNYSSCAQIDEDSYEDAVRKAIDYCLEKYC